MLITGVNSGARGTLIYGKKPEVKNLVSDSLSYKYEKYFGKIELTIVKTFFISHYWLFIIVFKYHFFRLFSNFDIVSVADVV